jgi:hypothetical protein
LPGLTFSTPDEVLGTHSADRAVARDVKAAFREMEQLWLVAAEGADGSSRSADQRIKVKNPAARRSSARRKRNGIDHPRWPHTRLERAGMLTKLDDDVRERYATMKRAGLFRR